MAVANCYLQEVYMPVYNAEFMQSAAEEGAAFVLWITDILCKRYERVVGHELQIPADRHRCHYVKARVTVLRYPNRPMAIMAQESSLHTIRLVRK